MRVKEAWNGLQGAGAAASLPFSVCACRFGLGGRAGSGFSSSSPSEQVRSIKRKPRHRLSTRWPTSFRDTENLSELLGWMLTEGWRIRESQSRCFACLDTGRASVHMVATVIPPEPEQVLLL